MKKILTIYLMLLTLNCFSQESEKIEINRFMTLNYVGNFIQAPIGISSVFHFKKSYLGMYFDVKFGTGDKLEGKDYTGIISINEAENVYNDPFRGEKETGIILFDIGLSYAMTKNKNLLAYGGLGYTTESVYRQYYDPTHILSSDGNYYIEDESKSSSGANFTAGLIYIMQSGLTLQGGFDVAPAGVNLGIGWTF